MANLLPVAEGWTEPIIHRLLNDDEAVSINGFTVELILQKADGTSITTSGKVANLDDNTDANKGKVKFSPGAMDLVEAGSNYYWRWKVTDGSGKVAFWPNDAAMRLRVYADGKPA